MVGLIEAVKKLQNNNLLVFSLEKNWKGKEACNSKTLYPTKQTKFRSYEEEKLESYKKEYKWYGETQLKANNQTIK